MSDISIDNKHLTEQLKQVGDLYVKELSRQLKLLDKDASGNLIKSLRYDIKVDSKKNPYIEILAADYLEYVDKGRRPGKMPPSNRILPWVKDRGIKIQGQTDEQTAFVIAKSIGIKGIKPTNVLDKTTKSVINKVTNDIAGAARQDIIDMINKIMK